MKQQIKILASSDDHLSNKNPKFKIDNLGVSYLLKNQHALSEYIAKLMPDFDMYINGGDLTDYANLDPVTSTYTNKYIKNIVDTGKPCIFLEGNHCISDTKNAFTVLGAISTLTDFSNCRFVFSDEVLFLNKDMKFIDSEDEAVLVIYCFPYFNDLKALSERIKKASDNTNQDKFNLMIFHFPCSNAFLDNGMTATRGINLSKEITKGFDLCLGGDYHKRQKLVNNDNAYYIGAPFDLKHGEHYERGLLTVSLDIVRKNYNLEYLKNPYQLPILDLTFSEVEKLEDSYLQNCVVRIKDEIDTDKKFYLDKRLFHKLSILNMKKKDIKTKAVNLEDIRVIKSNFSSSDRELLREYLKQSLEEEVNLDKVLEFFENNRT